MEEPSVTKVPCLHVRAAKTPLTSFDSRSCFLSYTKDTQPGFEYNRHVTEPNNQLGLADAYLHPISSGHATSAVTGVGNNVGGWWSTGLRRQRNCGLSAVSEGFSVDRIVDVKARTLVAVAPLMACSASVSPGV